MEIELQARESEISELRQQISEQSLAVGELEKELSAFQKNRTDDVAQAKGKRRRHITLLAVWFRILC